MYEELIKRLREAPNDWPDADLHYEAAEAIEELRKAVLRLEDESGIYDELPTFYIFPAKWIPAKERLPDVGKKVLVFAYGNDTLTARMQKQTENGYPVFECNGIFLEMAKPGRITHWMPLPSAPTEE